MAHIDDIIDYFFGEAKIPRKSGYANTSTDQPAAPAAPEMQSSYLNPPDTGSVGPIRAVQLPSRFADRSAPEKAAYAFEHLHDNDAGPEDHSADVRAVPLDPRTGRTPQPNPLMGPPESLRNSRADIEELLAKLDPSHQVSSRSIDGQNVYKTGHLGKWNPLEEQDALDYIKFLQEGQQLSPEYSVDVGQPKLDPQYQVDVGSPQIESPALAVLRRGR